MGWMNDHLHAFFFNIKNGKKNSGYSYTMYQIGGEGVDTDQYPILHTDRVCIENIDYKKHPKIGFVFDFGDNHQFMIEYKSTRKENKSDDFTPFPNLVDQRGVAPLQYPWTEDSREDFEMSEKELDQFLQIPSKK